MSMQVSAKTIIYKKNISKQTSIIKTISDKDIQCMAETVYSEARGESLAGKLAVGHTILTRSKKIFHQPVCKIIIQQYTQRRIPSRDKEEYHQLAKNILFGATKNPINGMDSFDSFRHKHRPKHTIKIGNHWFYKVLKETNV